MTHPLIERGFTVTAVDESPDMLRKVVGARPVCGTIEGLDLGEKFAVVLLASCLIHTPNPDNRRALLDTCRRHVTDSGCVLIQREGQGWHEGLPQERPLAGGTMRIVSSEPVAPGVRSVHIEYLFPDGQWTQTFLSHPLTTDDFETALSEANLILDSFLTDDGTWARAKPRL